jgi:hypothetical protein
MPILERNLFKVSQRLLMTWLGISALGFLFAGEIMSALLPFITWVVDLIEPGLSPLVTIRRHEGNEVIHLAAKTIQPLRISPSVLIPAGIGLTAAGSLAHALVPLVILWSLVIAWPTALLRERVILLLLSLPATIITVALTTPFLLAGRVEIMFSEIAFQRGEQRPEPFVVTWLLFTEGGGRWLLPVVMAVGCIFATKRIFAPSNSTTPI